MYFNYIRKNNNIICKLLAFKYFLLQIIEFMLI